MTREEAINLLGWLKSKTNRDDDLEAIDMAIEALQAEPTNGRPIDADALSKKLCETTIFIKDGEVFQRMINDAPTIEAVQGWIPCSERLPEIDETLRLCDQISEEVLGTDTYGNIWHVYLTKRGYIEPTFCTAEEGMSVDIVAWMPLPKPYKGGDDE